jgi:propionyl-CoA carboxylase alpha chain
MEALMHRLLIANRGEIVGRIARTAHRLGIETVGVYSEPDANALHVDMVDLAYALGGFSPAESYLRADAVLQAAIDSGCDSLHPGYGFLAENPDFAQQVIDAGLVFVGPKPEHIRQLGDKVEAKRIAARAGVPTTPIHEVVPGMVPPGIGMPALVKAAAGGGGRGMRIVRRTGELRDAVEAASREAEAAFGDGTVFIEPYIERGRHVEVQILGDSHGNGVHLGERECSIQRRNQKIIEEAPSAGITNDTRIALHEGAIALGREVEYENAGTVEFLVGQDGSITFLEVNARIQVEHPVTEAITGLDLVELQLRIADGEELPFRQEDVRFSGHAIEVRLVSEDPAAGWLPSTGEIAAFAVDESVRVDAGFRTGDVVSAEYDSLLAKIISHGKTRSEATRQLRRALQTARIAGPKTNLACLVAILGENDFVAAQTPTNYLSDHPEVEMATGADGDTEIGLLMAAVFAAEGIARRDDAVTGFAPSGWRNLQTHGQRQTWLCGDIEYEVEYVVVEADRAEVLIGQRPLPEEDGSLPDDIRRELSVRVLRRTEDEIVLEVDGVRRVVGVACSSVDPMTIHTYAATGSAAWTLAPQFSAPDLSHLGTGPICPLPGTVIAVRVEPGQTVSDGDVLVIVEAMKMEHSITANADATVVAIPFGVGDRVDSGDLLVELDVVGE